MREIMLFTIILAIGCLTLIAIFQGEHEVNEPQGGDPSYRDWYDIADMFGCLAKLTFAIGIVACLIYALL